MTTLGTASELDAVNELLASIGEDPVEDLENLPPSGNTALTVIRATSRDTQAEGHWFNQETDFVFVPDPISNEVLLPSNILGITGVDQDLIKRGGRLYDRDNKTFYFTQSVTCSVILHLPWDELPTTAQRYFTAIATERFIDGMPSEAAISDARNRNYSRALVAFKQDEIRNGKYNLLENSTISQLTRRS